MPISQEVSTYMSRITFPDNIDDTIVVKAPPKSQRVSLQLWLYEHDLPIGMYFNEPYLVTDVNLAYNFLRPLDHRLIVAATFAKANAKGHFVELMLKRYDYSE